MYSVTQWVSHNDLLDLTSSTEIADNLQAVRTVVLLLVEPTGAWRHAKPRLMLPPAMRAHELHALYECHAKLHIT